MIKERGLTIKARLSCVRGAASTLRAMRAAGNARCGQCALRAMRAADMREDVAMPGAIVRTLTVITKLHTAKAMPNIILSYGFVRTLISDAL